MSTNANYPHSYSDLRIDHFNQKYQFKGIEITKKGFDLIMEMIDNKEDRRPGWFYDIDGVKHTALLSPEEVATIDGLFMWGYGEFPFNDEDDDVEESTESPPMLLEPCRYASSHDFKKEAFTTWFHRECTKCGYSPELDFNKPKFKQCHKDFLEWEKL